MIHVDLKPEPADFDVRVRQPGNAFLNTTPTPNSKQWSKNNHWSRCSAQLYQAYGGVCAYSGEWFSRTTASVSVDHFYPKSSHQEMAYEWDNYRLTTQVMNGYKGDKIVLDPFEIKNGVLATIQILHLNDEDQANRRCEIVMEYICGNISQAFLKSKYPFIAEELQRQDLYEKIKEIIKVPVTAPA